MPRNYDNRNKTKSWREIDKQKEKGRSGHSDRDSKKDEKRAHSTVYKNYKKDLDSIFSGGDVPDYLKAELPASSPESEGQLKLLGAIRRSQTDGELDKAINAYLKKRDDFPDDLDLLLRVIDYSDESVQLKVAKALDRISKIQPIEHKQQFILKLDAISMMGEDDDLIELAEELVSRFR